MPHRMRKNVIVSQGGNHGKAAGTYLRDQPVSQEVADVLPDEMVATVREPGQASAPGRTEPPAKQSVQPPTTPTPQSITPPGTVKALRRWSAPKMAKLCQQEGIEAEGLDKSGLRALLTSHLNLK